MEIILVPGLWLDASSWDDVTPALEHAGHTVRPLTMPGVGAPASASSEIGIADWVDAVVDEIDARPDLVVLVGHSGGGNVVYGAADARPERVARIVFVDTFPPGDGGSIWEFPVVDGVIPFPGWDFFEEPEVADLDDATRSITAARAKSVPARVPTDPLRLIDDRRRLIPATMLTGTVPAAEIRGIIAAAPDWAAELAAVADLEVIELHSGHWPQFSQPAELSAAILRAVDR
ncbi:MAG: alpha/beta fold hydrolase [Microbacterium sp.]